MAAAQESLELTAGTATVVLDKTVLDKAVLLFKFPIEVTLFLVRFSTWIPRITNQRMVRERAHAHALGRERE